MDERTDEQTNKQTCLSRSSTTPTARQALLDCNRKALSPLGSQPRNVDSIGSYGACAPIQTGGGLFPCNLNSNLLLRPTENRSRSHSLKKKKRY